MGASPLDSLQADQRLVLVRAELSWGSLTRADPDVDRRVLGAGELGGILDRTVPTTGVHAGVRSRALAELRVDGVAASRPTAARRRTRVRDPADRVGLGAFRKLFRRVLFRRRLERIGVSELRTFGFDGVETGRNQGSLISFLIGIRLQEDDSRTGEQNETHHYG